MYPVNNRLHDLAFEENVKTRIRVYFISDSVDCTDDSDVQTNGTLLVGAAGDTDSNGRISFNQGVTFNEYFNPDKNIQIGTAVSSNVTMTLLNYDGALDGFSYGRCKIYLDVYDDENSVWLPCPMGVYIIDLPVKRKTKLVNVIGYDQMQKLDAVCDSWWKGLGWSSGLTILQILNSMATHLGMSVSSSTASAMVNSGLSFTAAPFDCVEVTYREVLETIAEATGTVAKFNRDGEIQLRWFGMPSGGGSFGESSCFSLDVAEYNVSQIDALRLKFAEGDIGVTIGSGTNEYVIQNNLFLNGANTAAITSKANPVYNRLSSFSQYAPVSGKMIYDWSLEAGDIITISTLSAMLIVPVFQSSMNWHGGNVVADVFCDGDEKRPVLDAALRDYYRLDSDMRTIVIEAPRINLLGYTTINDGFKINLDGTFEANGATINGTVTTSNPAYGQTTLGDGVLGVKNLNGDTIAVVGSDENVGIIRTTAIGYGSVELDGDTLLVNDENNQPKITASATAASGGQFTVKNSNGNNAFEVLGGKVYVNGGLSTSDGGDININKNVNITSGALDVTGAAAFGGNASVGGTLDVTGDTTIGGALIVTNRRAGITSNVASGWHRVLEFAPTTATYRLGRAGIIIDLDITRYATTNETHHVSLSLIETNAKFYGEFSNSNTQLIDKIRYTYDSSKGYVDIHLSTASTYNVAVDYQVAASSRAFFPLITTKLLEAVADSPSGETVLTEYTFGANGTFLQDINGFLNPDRTTIANGATGNIQFANSSSAYLLMTGVNVNCFILCAVRSNSSGRIYHEETIIGSGTIGATFSTSTNTLSIANSSGNELQILILRF